MTGRLELECVADITPESPAEFIGMRRLTPSPTVQRWTKRDDITDQSASADHLVVKT
jgi:hypothetical protein